MLPMDKAICDALRGKLTEIFLFLLLSDDDAARMVPYPFIRGDGCKTSG